MSDANPWFKKLLFEEPVPRPVGTAATEPGEWDVLVVGSGLTGLSAAIFAHDAGSSVAVLEAAAEGGGTTYKSGAGMWLPNNHFMTQRGLHDNRDEVLRFMAGLAYPEQFDADAEHFGVGEWEWNLMCAFFDNAGKALQAIDASGGLKVREFPSYTGDFPSMVPYHSDIDNSPGAFYRHVSPRSESGDVGFGPEAIRQLWAAAAGRGIDLRTSNRVRDIVYDSAGAVSGVIVETPAGETTLSARQGVIFATGGFAHNEELLAAYFRGPVPSSCAVPESQGDFHRIAREAGADLAQMRNGWLAQNFLEKVVEGGRVFADAGIMVPSGDSMIIVNNSGVRVGNEKAMYQERGALHFEQAEDGTYPHRVLVMVYDEALAHDESIWLNGDNFLAPKPWIIEAPTLQDLAAAVDERLSRLEDHSGGIRLTPDFAGNLERTIEKFNGYAATGVDDEFGRGKRLVERDWFGPARPGNEDNPTMHPFTEGGPYYAVLLCGHILDTNGGPRTDANARILRADGSVVEGLYGAGNCVASVAGGAYYSGGSTLGPALTFAYLAAQDVTQRERSPHAQTAVAM